MDTKWIFHVAKISPGAKSPWKCIYSVQVQEMAKHHAKFGWPPVNDVAAVTKPRRETGWNLLGCPKLPSRSQPLVGRSSPYCGDTWRRYYCLTSFFPIVNTCEDSAWQSCAMVRRWWVFVSFLRPVFPTSRVQHNSDLHSKLALRPHRV